jgi:hypothetical protein
VPLLAWPLAVVLGLLGAYASARPASAALLILLALVAGAGAWVLARPINGFALALCIFPVYTLGRAVAQLFGLPLPLTLVGMWPEMLLTGMLVSIVVGHIRRRRALRLTWGDAPMIVLVSAGVYGLALDVAQRAATAFVYGAHYSLTAFLFYFAARWCEPSRDDLRRLVRIFLVSYTLLAVCSLADYATRTDLSIRLSMAVRVGYWGQWDPYIFFKWYPRMQSLLFNEMLWGTLSAYVCLICLAHFSLDRPGRWVRPLFFLAMLCLLLSMARGGMITFSVGVLILLAISARRQGVAGMAASVVGRTRVWHAGLVDVAARAGWRQRAARDYCAAARAVMGVRGSVCPGDRCARGAAATA